MTRERSLASRFARSTPTQATAVDDTTVEVLCLVDGHTGAASTNRTDVAALEEVAVRARRIAAASAHTGRGEHPDLPLPGGPGETRTALGTATTRRPRSSIRGRGPAAAGAFDAAGSNATGGVRHLDVG